MAWKPFAANQIFFDPVQNTATTASIRNTMRRVWVPTDASQIIEYLVSDADDVANIWVLGYEEEL
jgi:hypothetical protein